MLFRARKCLLETAWNWFDFFVVIAGVIELGTGSRGGASSVRVLRVLHILQHTNSILNGMNRRFKIGQEFRPQMQVARMFFSLSKVSDYSEFSSLLTAKPV